MVSVYWVVLFSLYLLSYVIYNSVSMLLVWNLSILIISAPDHGGMVE
jgi:hypothetical protein